MTSIVEACKVLGYVGTDDLPDVVQAQVIAFVRAIVDSAQAKKPVDSSTYPPAAMWWLHGHSQLACLARRTGFWSVGKFKGRETWFLQTRASSTFLAVDDPLFVVQILLDPTLDSCEEAARWLVMRGVPFFMFVRQRHATARPPRFRPPYEYSRIREPLWLGWRPLDYVYGPRDYEAYVRARNTVLWSNPRMLRLALIAGGILWRIVLDALDIDLVVEGPSLWAHFTDMRNHADGFVEDSLYSDEIQFLCGMYHEPTSTANQKVWRSWWPLPETWKNSALDHGQWTPRAEVFYQSKVVQYRSDSAAPARAVEWKARIKKLDRRVLAFFEGARAHAKVLVSSCNGEC